MVWGGKAGQGKARLGLAVSGGVRPGLVWRGRIRRCTDGLGRLRLGDPMRGLAWWCQARIGGVGPGLAVYDKARDWSAR